MEVTLRRMTLKICHNDSSHHDDGENSLVHDNDGLTKPFILFLLLGYFSISPTVGGCELGGLRSSSPSQGQVHRGAAEVNLDLTRGT